MHARRSNASPPSTIDQATTLMRIVTGALVLGPVVFTIFSLATTLQKGGGKPPVEFLGPLSVGLLFVLGPAAVFVPRLLAARIPHTLAEEGPAPESWEAADVSARQAILSAWITNGIISRAMWEALAMLGATFLMVGHDFLSLAPALVGVSGVMLQFPTTSQVQAFADRQIEAWRNVRALANLDR